MSRLMAEYRIKEGTLEKVQAAVKKFMTEVHKSESETEYSAFQVDDSDRFIHIMAFVDKSAQERHSNATYTSEFVEVLYPNCVDPPSFFPIKFLDQ